MPDTIRALFTDIGGVLLTNGWDRQARKRAAETFDLDLEELNERHHLTYDTYESGKLSLEEYLRRVVFYRSRSFTEGDFREFMRAQSRPFEDVIAFERSLKQHHGLQIVAVSNEGRELSEFRTRNFGLQQVIDIFVCSGFVHVRKPDADMFRIALDMAQVDREEVVYLDDRPMFVEVARGLGLHGVVHSDLETTRKTLAGLGLGLPD